MGKFIQCSVLASFVFLLASCSAPIISSKDSAPKRVPDVSAIPDAIPKAEPRSRYGNPKQYTVLGKTYRTLNSAEGYQEKGMASWYGTKFHGRRTSSGEIYDMYAMTAAHKTLPLPTYVQVTNLENGKKIIVKVNDRGPFHENRIIDLSYSAATKLGIIAKGTGLVEVKAISTKFKSVEKNMVQPQLNTAALSPVIPSASMFLQVGAFSSLKKAEEVKQKIERTVANAVVIVPFELAQGTLYRVRVGPLDNVDQGDNLAAKLASIGFSNTHIIID
ncbi:MAG TPA: septal ring lytic transglycosylase RlpA family protein [Methylophaga aminisulfidivorans]|uniref:Endolytic peptidoglycan transglycosylase RlpA n=2 Tax=root TaxID=1 RepID=A0A7C1VTG3_9GAMM|nr:septal ring lytic transglycosylase RlpA family protein [Methylophaga aminisulfidivorans]